MGVPRGGRDTMGGGQKVAEPHAARPSGNKMASYQVVGNVALPHMFGWLMQHLHPSDPGS